MPEKLTWLWGHFLRQGGPAVLALALALAAWQARAADLAEIRARGELRHLGIRYANFVTGEGDGFDVELVRGFAREIGVRYTLVYTDFYSVLRDLLGQDVVKRDGTVTLEGSHPVRGDMIAAGFTVLPWREQVVLYSSPTFPSQVLLVAPAASPFQPIKGGPDLAADIAETRALIGPHSLLVMERTCLDPANYDLKGKGLDLRAYTRSTNLNEMVPALLNHEADFTLLDVPDAMLDLQKWAGRIKVIGPISPVQDLAAAFPRDAPGLRDAFNRHLDHVRADGRYDALVARYYPGIRRAFPAFFAAGK
ncbi:Transporter substrate-binding domain-containing protein [Rhodovastum atsumiense]|uniref:Transporter substrate-binding domain-containing protein n=1 Tax=Rhodovastum atsumiense TaxID=504468 RepID=A0A5M6IS71_9PROT|nr:transporter substrate-binding domain-containing protein [Rhodovastum atsumiense]KAA5610418.1 transporter substrate-binding domain-containing protein [Rhodovastum atsumiense]CAH2602894.1 Transporter substrate-binding domain-containing protein [Rhodovastum atsumiense]